MKILKKHNYDLDIELDLIKGTVLEKIYKKSGLGKTAVIYIACVADLSASNPYSSLKVLDKRNILIKKVFKSDKTYDEFFLKNEKKLIEEGFKEYDVLFNSAMDRDMATYNIQMDQLNDMLAGLNPVINKNTHDVTLKTTFSTNIDIINKVLQDIVSIIEAKFNIGKTYNAEATIKVYRGKKSKMDKKASPLERGLLTNN